jgi:Condensation domain
MHVTMKPDDVSCTELSLAEELMWQAELGGPAVPPFFDCGRNLWLVLRLQGPLNREALKFSLNAVVERHHVLRSRFVARNGRPVRLISQVPSFNLTIIERQELASRSPDEIVADEIKPLLDRQLDLARNPLLRAALAPLGGNEHILAITIPHIIFDRWSMRLLELELKRFYCAFVTGAETGGQPLPAQYQDYVSWQREQMNSERARNLSTYWINKLDGLPDLMLPCDGAGREAVSTRSGSAWFTVPAEETGRLVVLSRRGRTTLAATMLAIFVLFLNRLSGMDDIAVGVPISDRRRPEFEEVIGLFMNVIVVRTSIPNQATFLGLLDRVRRNLVDACLHQDMPCGHLQRIIPRRPLYRAVFNFMPALGEMDLQWADLRAELLPVPMELQALADLSLHLRHEAGMLLCRLVYKADLFSEDCARRFAIQFQALIAAILQGPENCVNTCHSA